MHGKLRDSMCVISVAIPKKLKEYLDRKIDFDSSSVNRSDLLRKILLDYAKGSIPAEIFAEIMAEITQAMENRQENAISKKEKSQKQGLYTKKKRGDI